MTDATAIPQPDPTLEVAELQLAMLGELAQMAMVVSRAYAAASVVAAEAVQTILADEVWQPETGRARALAGAKDAADAFQKVSRVVRLTLMLAKTTAEWVRDARNGTCTPGAPKKDAAGTPADHCDVQDRQSLPRPSSRGRAGSCPDHAESDTARSEPDRERLDIERPGRLPAGPFRETVDSLCGVLGGAIDWSTWKIQAPDVEHLAMPPKPPAASPMRPPKSTPRWVRVVPTDAEAEPPP